MRSQYLVEPLTSLPGRVVMTSLPGPAFKRETNGGALHSHLLYTETVTTMCFKMPISIWDYYELRQTGFVYCLLV